MGVPKSKVSGGQDGAAARASTAKRARTEELTGVRFKAQLRDPQGAGPGECSGEESASLRGDLISQLLLSAWGLRVQTQQLLSAARVRAQPPDLQSGNRDLGAGESRATICLMVTVSLRVHASPARAASVSKL